MARLVRVVASGHPHHITRKGQRENRYCVPRITLTGCIVRAPARVNGEGLGLIQPQAQGWIDVGEDTYIKEFSPKQGEEPGEILGPRSSTGMW
jgi:hypothetical protein